MHCHRGSHGEYCHSFRHNRQSYLYVIRNWDMHPYNNSTLHKATAFIFDTTLSCDSVKVFETENVSTWEGLEPPTFGFMPNALTIWALRARHLLSHVLNTGSGGIDIFDVKLTFEMLTVRGQQHSFSTHERMFLWQCQRFWDRKCLDPRGTRTPNFGFMPNALTIWVSGPIGDVYI